MGSAFSRNQKQQQPAVPTVADEEGAPVASDLQSIVQGGHHDGVEYPDLPVEDTPEMYGMGPRPDMDNMPAVLEWYNERYRRRAVALGVAAPKKDWAGDALAQVFPAESVASCSSVCISS